MVGFLFVILVQLLLEVLPVSSSAHVELFSKIVKSLNSGIAILPDYMDHVLHGPTVIVIALFFYQDWKKYFWAFIPHFRDRLRYRKRFIVMGIRLIALIFVATIPTAILYFFIKEFLKNCIWLHGDYMQVIGLIITGGMLLSLRMVEKDPRKNAVLSFPKSFFLGVIQGVALLPGISRFGSTYVASRWLGFAPRRSMQLSFLLYIPVGSAAFLRGLVKMYQAHVMPTLFYSGTLWVFVVGGIASYFIFCWVYTIALRNQLWLLGIYMIVPVVLSLFYLLF